MKAVQKLRMFARTSPFLSPPPFKTTPFHHYFSTSSIELKQQDLPSNTQPGFPNPTDASLTQEEITQINLLIPRLCSSNHFKEAANLITTALHTNPPVESLPISIFLQSLTMEPDLTQAMYFLNQIKFNPKIMSFLKPITKMFVSCYFDKGLPRKALKIFHWVSRGDYPRGCVDVGFYDVMVNGFWRYGMTLEALRVLRVMVNENLEIKDSVRIWVYRGLLREARVKEALELNKGLEGYAKSSECKEKLLELLDNMIASWIE